ncbi:MAG: 2-hydroxyacyl-CoA dehydratase, partial [Abditibacteriota bacterium]|nr:2-hydroxyacyl-CoA dehydratase [Abditibacteriota bacterium]
SDIQPLLNQGVRREDVAGSIFYAVVNQTIAGLAQSREIKGNVLYLGGPLTFYPYLREAFDKTLGLKGTCPANSLYYAALGAAFSPAAKPVFPGELAKKYTAPDAGWPHCPPLFANREEYEAFKKRHEADSAGIAFADGPEGEMFLGIDAGSTTVKAVLCDSRGRLFFPMYMQGGGDPVGHVREYLSRLYREYPGIRIGGSAVTGYGEQIIQNAFAADMGVVETIAHFTAASRFCPEVDFIIDIGGQDIKCFHIRQGGVDSIFLNEACSSGCGSFLQTFAAVLGFSPEEFARKALFADRPVDLGSRCTVFMNSSVKQAQKDGASLENISAGLAISVVKNALYKVIRCADPSRLGQHIVVQGGTFLNDAVLRAFEQETGKEVLRPSVSGLMGAYGAALYAMAHRPEKSSLCGPEELERFEHKVSSAVCGGCSNHCRLTVNAFSGGRRFIAGNRCEKPLRLQSAQKPLDLYEYKYSLLEEYQKGEVVPDRINVGLPMGLNMYELLPFWHTLFRELGFNPVVSGRSDYGLYISGQHTIPSDTVCYPAKLLHGHMERLIAMKPEIIFYPGMSYNVEENRGDNHYNCPVVAYYPRLIEANVKIPPEIRYIDRFIGLADRKGFAPRFVRLMKEEGFALSAGAVKKAAAAAFREYDGFMQKVKDKAAEFLKEAEKDKRPVIVLAGRPYHVDPEINHGINTLICQLGGAVLTEDSVADLAEPVDTTVLNQWTYHARLYTAAEWAARQSERINLVQLVSFGCGVDAVTGDEVRAILESRGRLYTQIKIDEITNLGAVKIRLRSLFAVARDKLAK